MVNLNEIVNNSKSVLVEFYASWCPHCQRMSPVLDHVEKKAGKKLKVERFDIDAPQNEQLVNSYKIQTIPTMLFFHNGEQVWRHSGELPEQELEKIVSTHNA
ncbi:MAG: thioredoxin family protein [Culturomica sp.]|jgi:thioredoxin 1|nr:thioredoxin family protein [Culturomica sp.]